MNIGKQPGVSRPTGNKREVKRERFGPSIYASHMIHILSIYASHMIHILSIYASHMIHILEKTHADIYTDFRRENPDIKNFQRSFENCKPFFVRPVRQKDRQTCCCRYHIETKAAFKARMGFGKQSLLQKELDNDNDDVPLFSHSQDLIDITLCKTGDIFHNISCLKRQCDNCGVQNLKLLDEEIDVSESALNVKWEQFEYVNVSVKGGKTIKILQLVVKETKAGVLFFHLKQLLINFPFHQHRSL